MPTSPALNRKPVTPSPRRILLSRVTDLGSRYRVYAFTEIRALKHLLPVCLSLFCLPLMSCEGVSVGFVSNPSGGAVQSITGTVSATSLQYYHDPSGTTTFTSVTFVDSLGTSTTMNFCGDQRPLFPLDQTVRADFRAGFVCAGLVQVVSVAT